MKVIARTLREPVADQWGLVGCRIVEDHIHLNVVRHVLIDGVQNGAKVPDRMTRPAFAHYPARADIQDCKQIRGATPNVIMRVTLDLARTHRQNWLGGLFGLDLRLHIHAQHQRSIRRRSTPDYVCPVQFEGQAG